MNLIDKMMSPFVIMDKLTIPDGEGGYNVQWREGAEIQIAIATDTSMRAQIAQATQNISTYSMVMRKDIYLGLNDVVKRVEDGQTFRITSDSKDGIFPNLAGSLINDYVKVTAERWELTT